MTTTVGSSGSRGRAGLGEALGGALQWRLLLAWTLLMLLPTAVIAMPSWHLLGAILDWSPRAAETARRFDMLVFEDIIVGFGRGGAGVVGATLLSSLLAVSLSPLVAALALTAAREPSTARPLGFVALMQGAVAGYGRMFRMMLVSLLPLAVVGGIAAMAYAIARKHVEHAILESQANHAKLVERLVIVILFVLIHATVEAGRAELAADERLRSAWRAWIRGVRLTLRQPLAVLGRYVGATVVSLVVASVLVLIRLRLVGGSGGGFWLGFLVTQLAVAAIGWGRASRLFALTTRRRSLAPADTSRP
ncbi:MAG: hypothetical protein ACXVDD_06025 [Polyangia bacterium]